MCPSTYDLPSNGPFQVLVLERSHFLIGPAGMLLLTQSSYNDHLRNTRIKRFIHVYSYQYLKGFLEHGNRKELKKILVRGLDGSSSWQNQRIPTTSFNGVWTHQILFSLNKVISRSPMVRLYFHRHPGMRETSYIPFYTRYERVSKTTIDL